MEAFLEIVIGIIFWIGLIQYVRYTSKKRYITGTLEGRSGQQYTYVMGDRLHYGNTPGLFSGIDIKLPVMLPHIYLDGLVRESVRGPRQFMHLDQRLELEGDFNQYFACYVPRHYHVLALSILAPDVMQTLRREVPDCDVEIYMTHLRIIVNHKVFNRQAAAAALRLAAGAVLQQIDDRLRSWTDADSSEALGATLTGQDNPTIKLFGHGFRLTTVLFAPLFIFVGLINWWATFATIHWPVHVTISWLAAKFWFPVLIFPGLYVFFLYVVPSKPFEGFADRIFK